MACIAMVDEADDHVAPVARPQDVTCERTHAFERSGLEQGLVRDVVVDETLAYRAVGGCHGERAREIAAHSACIRRKQQPGHALRRDAFASRQTRTVLHDELGKTELAPSAERQSPQAPATSCGAPRSTILSSGGSIRTSVASPAAFGAKTRRTLLKLTSSASGPTL